MLCIFSAPPTAETYTLSLPDALPISGVVAVDAVDDELRDHRVVGRRDLVPRSDAGVHAHARDRKSTRLNSSHEWTAYAVFCLKKESTPLATPEPHVGNLERGYEPKTM